MRTAMMAITTSNSIKVKPRRCPRLNGIMKEHMERFLVHEWKDETAAPGHRDSRNGSNVVGPSWTVADNFEVFGSRYWPFSRSGGSSLPVVAASQTMVTVYSPAGAPSPGS